MRDLNDLTRPTVPSGAIQERMTAETEERRGVVGPAPALPDDAGAPAGLRTALGEAVAELAPQIVALSHDIHDHPETGYEEHHAVAAVADLLRRHGIEPEVGVYGMDTALRAEIPGAGSTDAAAGGCGESAGTIAILAEYDALPGRVVLQTTPAEENSTAKEILAVRGMLDGVDAAIQTHSYAHDVTHQTWLGVRRLRVIFHGVPAHAASQPFMGRNALDAATLALTGIGLLRQQMLPMDRLHAIVTDGGQVPNIIPERTELSIMVRSKYLETLKEIAERVEEVLHGAALMTGTGVEILTSEYCNEVPVRDNGPLLTSWVRSQRERGRDPLAAGVLPETIAAGTDFGNVSQRVPGIHPLIKVTDRPDVALHTPAMTEAAGAPTGDAAALDGAYGLAAVALDWLHDAELRRAVRADFEATGGAIDVAGFWEE
ncbi:peptidase dimerization domain-containing protein [Actinomyces oris]|uniref:Peptidase M20 domain-containing protein 2 n=1 Tax=Actinomyces oris TaxID=544580 RepID=A0A1Q8V5I4_9ACTO|nr:peptidase dimerization domain-containing protein [Actinomyces oris]OLO43381.1 peptidase M20 [Actinomyces oris]